MVSRSAAVCPLALALTLGLGCGSKVGTLELLVLRSPEATEEPLRDQRAAWVRIRVLDDGDELASAEFRTDDHRGILSEVEVGSDRVVVVEGLDPDRRAVVSLGRSGPLEIRAGDNRLALFVGLKDQFSLTPQLFAPDVSCPPDDNCGAQATCAGTVKRCLCDPGWGDCNGDLHLGGEGDGCECTLAGLRSMASPRAFHTATRLRDGRLLLCGGTSERWRPSTATAQPSGVGQMVPTASVERLDENALLFETLDCGQSGTCLLASRAGHTSTLLPTGNVLLSGGYGEGSLSGTTEVYDQRQGTFFAGNEALDPPSAGHSAVLSGESVAVAGGQGSGLTALSRVQFFPADSAKLDGTQMITERRNFTLVSLADGTLVAIGGFDKDLRPLDTTEVLAPAPGQRWQSGPELVLPRAHHRSVLLADGSIVVIGGLTDDGQGGLVASDTIERLDLAAGRSVDSGVRLNRRRWAHSATRLDDGRILVVGGFAERPTGAPLSFADVVDLERRTVGERRLRRRRAGHTATRLRSGFVLIAGGITGNQAAEFPAQDAEVFVY